MLGNPFVRFGVTRTPPAPVCSLGVAGEFPSYTSGLAYTGDVSITGANGATTVELISSAEDAVGSVYASIQNAGFETLTGWAKDTTRTPEVSPGFSIQSGTGRNGTGFLRWQGNPDGKTDKFNSLTVVKTPGNGTINAKIWVKCTSHSGGGGVVQAGIRIEQFADEACTIPLNETISEFANFTTTDTSWRAVRSWSPDFGGYCRVSVVVTQGVAISGFSATVEFDDAEWDARQVVNTLVTEGSSGITGAFDIPLTNGSFASGSTSWSVQTQTTSPGFSFQPGAGRSGNGFLRWQCSGPMGVNDADVIVNTRLVQTSTQSTTGKLWAKCTAIGATSETIYAQVAVQMQVFADAAGTQLLGSYLLGFLRFYEVLDWRQITSSCPTAPGQYVRFSIWVGSGVAATLEFDDCEWNAKGLPALSSIPQSEFNLPSGFTINTQISPDRVRVQWPGIPAPTNLPYAMLHFDGTNGSTSFPDESGKTWTRLGSTVVSTTQSRFGGAAGQFAAGWGLRGPFDLSWTQSNVNDDGNWTAEFWLYLPATIPTYQPIFAINDLTASLPGSVVLRISGGTGAGVNEIFAGASSGSGAATGYVVPTSQWVHMAVVRDRQFTRFYADGVLRWTDTGNGGSISNAAIWLGRMDGDFGSGSGFSGFLDEFRFSRSALYSGSTITVPTAPFTYSGGPATSTLANLGFESGDADWLKGAGWSITNAAPTDVGTWSAKYNGLGQSNIAHQTLAPVSPGTSITASCRVSKGTNRDDFAGGAVLLQWFDSTLGTLGFNVGNVVNTGTSAFQTSTVTATAPAGAAYVRLAASGTRDVKGRATDAVVVDAFSWNHTFALGGAGGSGNSSNLTPITGPITFSFRVRDSQGCAVVATRTIEEFLSSGKWILFGRPQGSSGADQYSITSISPTSWSGSKRLAVAGGNAGDVYISGFGGGSLYAAQLSGWVIRSTNLGATWSTTNLVGCSQNQRIDVRNGRVMFAIPSAFRYSDDNGATVTTSSGRPINERYFYGTNEILGGNRSGEDLLYSSDNGANRDFVSGFPTYGSGRNPVNLCAGSTHIVVAGSSFGSANKFSRVPISTPLASHTPFTVPAVSSTATWGNVAPSIAYGNGIFVMVTDQGQIVRSTDEGATWTVSSFTFPNPRSLAYGDGVFLICGDAGTIYVSTNGNTWTQIDSGTFGTDNITNAIFIPN